MNTVTINQLQQLMTIGLTDEERAFPQMITLDLIMTVDMEQSFSSDDLNHTLDYTQIGGLINSLASENQWNLLEKMCFDIGQQILSQFSLCQDVSIRATKRVLQNAKSASVAINVKR